MSDNLLRVGAAVGIRPEDVDAYRKLHRDVWPDIRQALNDANIHNYSIFYLEPLNVMFSYYEYTGTDREADSRRHREAPRVQDWLNLCRQYQRPLAGARENGRVWQDLPSFFHLD